MNRTTIFILAGILTAAPSEAAEPMTPRPKVESLAHACSGCHGTYGHSKAPTPVLAGKPEEDIVNALKEFKSGERVSSIMNRIARAYTEDDMEGMARFFSKQ